jgi:hypothetical protein
VGTATGARPGISAAATAAAAAGGGGTAAVAAATRGVAATGGPTAGLHEPKAGGGGSAEPIRQLGGTARRRCAGRRARGTQRWTAREREREGTPLVHPTAGAHPRVARRRRRRRRRLILSAVASTPSPRLRPRRRLRRATRLAGAGRHGGALLHCKPRQPQLGRASSPGEWAVAGAYGSRRPSWWRIRSAPRSTLSPVRFRARERERARECETERERESSC